MMMTSHTDLLLLVTVLGAVVTGTEATQPLEVAEAVNASETTAAAEAAAAAAAAAAEAVLQLSEKVTSLQETVGAGQLMIEALAHQVGELNQTLNDNHKQVETLLDALGRKLNETDAKVQTILSPPHDCSEVINTKGDGLYKVYPGGSIDWAADAFCEWDNDGSPGWTVVQRRVSGSVDFDQAWGPYKNGFGNLEDNFWWGLHKMRTLTKRQAYTMQIFLRYKQSSGVNVAEYSHFQLNTEEEAYKLDISGYSGNATDGMAKNGDCSNGAYFSTHDADFDGFAYTNCASRHGGGWWFNRCGCSDLNGPWRESGFLHGDNGIGWYTAYYDDRAPIETRMRIRPQ